MKCKNCKHEYDTINYCNFCIDKKLYESKTLTKEEKERNLRMFLHVLAEGRYNAEHGLIEESDISHNSIHLYRLAASCGLPIEEEYNKIKALYNDIESFLS